MKTSKQMKPRLAWIRDLPEVGTLRDLAAKEEAKLARRAELLKEIAALDAALVTDAKRGEREARVSYSAPVVAATKAGDLRAAWAAYAAKAVV